MKTKSNMSAMGLREAIDNIEPYQPGKFIEDLQGDFQLSDIIKIASNENPYAPYPESIQCMRDEIIMLNKYPDSSFKILREALAEIHGISSDCICLSHGAEGMLQTIGKCFLSESDEVIIPQTTYSLYQEISKVMGAKVVMAPLKNDGIDIDSIINRMSDRTKLIWIANPNNPTGNIVDKTKLNQLLELIPDKAWIILDEAYAEFSDPGLLPDRVKLIREGKCLISVRTFSKAYGLAGARLGYAIASERIITAINTVSEPFNANRVAIAGALAVIQQDGKIMQEAVDQIKADRKKIEIRLKAINLRVIPSHANFIMFETPFLANDLFNLLLKRGVIVRSCTAWGYNQSIRVTIGSTKEMEVFLNKLVESLDELQNQKKD
jgi:histidinol-phosphate aminotransferase